MWHGDLLLGPFKVSLLGSLLLHNMSSEATQVTPFPITHLPLCFAKFLFRFLQDKNSREFLYYRKKVAEIRKEAQKLQTASQKGKWIEGMGASGEACG